MKLYLSALWVKPWQVTTPNSLICKILGRNFEYDEALKIIQFEEYTDDINFDEIKRYDIQKRIGDRKINLRKRRELGVKNAGENGDNSKQNKKVHTKQRKNQAKDRFRLDNS